MEKQAHTYDTEATSLKNLNAGPTTAAQGCWKTKKKLIDVFLKKQKC